MRRVCGWRLFQSPPPVDDNICQVCKLFVGSCFGPVSNLSSFSVEKQQNDHAAMLGITSIPALTPSAMVIGPHHACLAPLAALNLDLGVRVLGLSHLYFIYN